MSSVNALGNIILNIYEKNRQVDCAKLLQEYHRCLAVWLMPGKTGSKDLGLGNCRFFTKQLQLI